MKAIKYTISFCILFIGMLIIGESHIFRLNNFYTQFANTTMYLQENTNSQEMIRDIVNAASRNHVEVFTFLRTPLSTSAAEFDIYGTSNVESFFNDEMNIFQQQYESMFLGSIFFSFHEFDNIPDIDKFHDFFVIGDMTQVQSFKMDLIDKYAGNHPKEGFTDTGSRNTAVSIWLLITIVILLLTYYDVIFQKKENLIRISLGERIATLIWKNIVLDSAALLVFFSIALWFLSRYTYVFFEFSISIILFGFLLAANGLLYLNLLAYNLKEVFSNVKGSRKLLSLTYSLKLITAVITIFIISSNIAFIFESYSLYKQKSFFEDHAGYFYTRLEYRLVLNEDGSITGRGDESTNVQAAFYKEFFEKFNATVLTSISNFSRGPGVMSNRNALSYLSSRIQELRNLPLHKDIYFILPDSLNGDTTIFNELKEAVRFYEGDRFIYNYDVIYYHDNVRIISIDENSVYGSKQLENPIIIYNNLTADQLTKRTQDDAQKVNYVHDIMYRINNEEFERFVKEHNLQDQLVAKTNVLDNYSKNWVIAKQILYMNFVFSALVLFLEFIIIGSILKLEYEVNAIELTLKKTLGHGLLEKNKKIVLLTLITTLASMGAALIAALVLGLDEVWFLVTGGLTLLLAELVIIARYIRKIEKANVQKILKGGNL